MDVSLGNIVSIGIPLAGAIAGYAQLRYRVGVLESQVKAIEDVKAAAVSLDGKIETIRKDQGTRVGQLTKELNLLTGFVQGRNALPTNAQIRRRTAEGGIPIVTSPEE